MSKLELPVASPTGMRRSVAMGLVLLGALCMSFAALFVRHIDAANGMQILAYRGISQGAMVMLVACWIRRTSPSTFLKSFDSTDWTAGVVMAFAFGLYIFSLLNTSVASTLFILSISPVFAAFLGWFWIGEKPGVFTLGAILLALVGVFVMVAAGFDSGRTFGNMLAVGSAICFAFMLVLARRSGKPDLLGGNFLGAVLAMLAMAGLALLLDGHGLGISMHDAVIILVMGAFTIGLGIAFVAWAAPNLPAAEVSLLMLAESVLAPIWSWLFTGEQMSFNEIAGGTILLASVVLLVVQPRSRAVTV